MALIKCPECNHEVSDKAALCPNCGYPISESSNPTSKKKEQKKHTTSMRRANGMGHVTILSGNRRRPYAARLSEQIILPNGKTRLKYKYVGYSETYEGAQKILDDYYDSLVSVSAINDKESVKKRFNKVRTSLSVKEELERVDKMDGHRFEKWCADLLELCGFENVNVTIASGDKGVDVVAEKEQIKYAIQCKRFNAMLGNKPIQEIAAGKVYYKCHVAVVMTNSSFSTGAMDLAKETGVLLWDRKHIIKLLKECKRDAKE